MDTLQLYRNMKHTPRDEFTFHFDWETGEYDMSGHNQAYYTAEPAQFDAHWKYAYALHMMLSHFVDGFKRIYGPIAADAIDKLLENSDNPAGAKRASDWLHELGKRNIAEDSAIEHNVDIQRIEEFCKELETE